jgi:hypothetical protein
VIKKAGAWLEHAGHAVIISPDLIVAALQLFDATVIDKAADKQVEIAIVVVVEPDRAGGPAGRADAGFFSDVSERPVVIVLVQSAAAVSSSLRSCATCSEIAASETPRSTLASLTDPRRATAAKARSCVGVTRRTLTDQDGRARARWTTSAWSTGTWRGVQGPPGTAKPRQARGLIRDQEARRWPGVVASGVTRPWS